MSAEASNELFFVVVNHEEQYSIWEADLPVPEGWQVEGSAQQKVQCLAYIDEVWTDIRPKSSRPQ